ncbi:MAG: potassium transporter TrkG [Burkholderiales bacterium]|jgi:trk system potassium uptake protein TrkH
MRLAQSASGSLTFAVRPRVIAHFGGRILVALALLLLVPLAVCILAGDSTVALRLSVTIALLLVIGVLIAQVRIAEPLQHNEALVLAALTFVLPPIILVYPLVGYGIESIDAWFEAVSAVTTTGLSTLGSPQTLPGSLLFMRAWLQWAGGLAIVVLVLAFVGNSSFTARYLGFDSAEAQDIAGGTRAHAKRAILIYVGVTIIGIVVLSVFLDNWAQATVYGLAAISTGGFASKPDSVAGFSLPAQAAVMTLCVAGAIAFYSYYRPAYQTWRVAIRDVQLRALLVAAIAVSVLLYWLLPANGSMLERAAHAIQMGISAQTTAGFSSLEVSRTSNAAQLTMVVAMLTGGALGSTAGGIKMLRLVVMWRLLRLLLTRLAVPVSAHVVLRVEGSRVSRKELESMLAVVFAFLMVLLAGWFAFLYYGHAPMASLFEVSSALATAGLSSGLSGPELQPVLKAVLCIVMLMGRVETVALLVLLAPRTWVGKRRSAI